MCDFIVILKPLRLICEPIIIVVDNVFNYRLFYEYHKKEERFNFEITRYDVHFIICSYHRRFSIFPTFTYPDNSGANYRTNTWRYASRRDSRCTSWWPKSTTLYHSYCHWSTFNGWWPGWIRRINRT